MQAFNYFSTELLIIGHKTQEILPCVFEEVRTNLVLKQEMNKSAWKNEEKVEKQTHDRNKKNSLIRELKRMGKL